MRGPLRTLITGVFAGALLCASAGWAKPPKGKKSAVTAPAKDKKKPADIKLKPDEVSDQQDGSAASTQGGPPPSRGPTRIDFDDRLVQGQTNKSGAVYLYDRKELKTRSMIKKRESFREEIIGTVYGG